MMSLVVSACLAASPADCQLIQIGTSSIQGYKACRLEMEQTVVLWKISHPDHIVRAAFCIADRSPAQT